MTATIERHKSGKIAYVTEVGGNGEVLKFGEPGVAFTKEQCEKVAKFNDGRLNVGELRIIDPKGKVLKTVRGTEPPEQPKGPEPTVALLRDQVAYLQSENERILANQPKIAGLLAEAKATNELLDKVNGHYDELAALITDEEDGKASHDEVVRLLKDILNETETTGENAAEVARLREEIAEVKAENERLKADLAAAEELAKEGSTAGE